MPSKLGPHCLTHTAEARDMVAAGSPLAKVVAGFGQVDEFLSIRPDMTIIGRAIPHYTLLDQYHDGQSPRAAAERFVRDQVDRDYKPNPAIKIWEGHNEPSFGGPNDDGVLRAMAWYGAFEAERLRLLDEMGLRGVIGNFSTGYPEISNGLKGRERRPDLRMWEAFLPALEAAQRYDGMLGLHEYGGPWMWWLTGRYLQENCPENRDGPGWGDDLGSAGWLTLRYRQVYNLVLIPHGLGNVPLVITECGTDSVGGACQGGRSGPWKHIIPFWMTHDGRGDPIPYWRGSERDAERYYAEQLIWYDRELQRDPYVVGATIFTFGTLSHTWIPYDLAGTRTARYLIDHVRRAAKDPPPPQNEIVSPPTPEPAPPDPVTPPLPEPEQETTEPPPVEPSESEQPDPAPVTIAVAASGPRGFPRQQYSRVYVLLPPNLRDPEWVTAIADTTWNSRRFTIGGSADDAGIGNLHARAVIAVNPDAWGYDPPLAQWFRLRYPGVEYSAIQAYTTEALRQQLQRIPLPKPQVARDGSPQVEVGRPRQQYVRNYVLLNPTQSDSTWVNAIAQIAWRDHRMTIGGSADDAGIGDLDTRRVIAVNPHQGWDGDLQAWFGEHYPGVEYHAIVGVSPSAAAERLLEML